jgi:hypothetical protein
MTDLDLYLNFVIHAVLGKLSAADALMSMVGDQIRSAAEKIATQHPIPPAPLYRGMLLEPGKPYVANPRLMFLSWSEDRDVARWFACPRSAVSEPLAAHNPRLRGHLVELATAPPRLLFHHSWAAFLPSLSAFALAHPLMGSEGKHQIEWSLRTQREVITGPVDDLSPKPTVDLDGDALADLERRFSPPWIIEQEGIRR